MLSAQRSLAVLNHNAVPVHLQYCPDFRCKKSNDRRSVGFTISTLPKGMLSRPGALERLDNGHLPTQTRKRDLTNLVCLSLVFTALRPERLTHDATTRSHRATAYCLLGKHRPSFFLDVLYVHVAHLHTHSSSIKTFLHVSSVYAWPSRHTATPPSQFIAEPFFDGPLTTLPHSSITFLPAPPNNASSRCTRNGL
jgi:hypothetical protein